MTDRKKAIEVLRLSEPMQKTHSLMETAICIAKRESYLTDEEEATLREVVDMAIQALEKESCDDAISREAAIRLAEQGQVQGFEWQFKQLVDLPSVSTEKTGHWRHYEGMLICSECGAEFYDDIMEYCGDDVPKCCPDCGTKMEVKE